MYRLLKSITVVINRFAAYQMAIIKHGVKTTFIAGVYSLVILDLVSLNIQNYKQID